MPKSNAVKGAIYEKEVEDLYKENGYKTHRNIKSRFGKQDVFGIGDILATKSKEFLIIACTHREQGAKWETVQKIKAIRPYIPKSIRILYYIKRKDREEIKEY